jgi:hypothetical protein
MDVALTVVGLAILVAMIGVARRGGRARVTTSAAAS